MAKKCAIRRARKKWPSSAELVKAMELDDELALAKPTIETTGTEASQTKSGLLDAITERALPSAAPSAHTWIGEEREPASATTAAQVDTSGAPSERTESEKIRDT